MFSEFRFKEDGEVSKKEKVFNQFLEESIKILEEEEKRRIEWEENVSKNLKKQKEYNILKRYFESATLDCHGCIDSSFCKDCGNLLMPVTAKIAKKIVSSISVNWNIPEPIKVYSIVNDEYIFSMEKIGFDFKEGNYYIFEKTDCYYTPVLYK